VPTPAVTEILEFLPLPALDSVHVETALRLAVRPVVGYYRISPPGALSLSDGEKALAAHFFSNPSCVFLLIEATEAGFGDAMFCFWGEGQLFDLPVMVFPFNAGRLASAERQRQADHPIRAVVPGAVQDDSPGSGGPAFDLQTPGQDASAANPVRPL